MIRDISRLSVRKVKKKKLTSWNQTALSMVSGGPGGGMGGGMRQQRERKEGNREKRREKQRKVF